MTFPCSRRRSSVQAGGRVVGSVVCWCPVGVVQRRPPSGWAWTCQPGMGLEPVVVGAVAGEVGFAGGAPVGPGGDVVEFAVCGFLAAAGESAVDVAGADVVGEPRGWVVGGAAVVEQGARQGVGDQPPPHPVCSGLSGEGGGDRGRARRVRRAGRRRRSTWSKGRRPGSVACPGSSAGSGGPDRSRHRHCPRRQRHRCCRCCRCRWCRCRWCRCRWCRCRWCRCRWCRCRRCGGGGR